MARHTRATLPKASFTAAAAPSGLLLLLGSAALAATVAGATPAPSPAGATRQTDVARDVTPAMFATHPKPADATRRELTHLPPEAEADRVSTPGAKTTVDFRNRRKTSIKVYWINYSGCRVLYATLAPGASTTITTFVGHPWVIADPHDRGLFVVMPAATPGKATATHHDKAA